MPTKSTHHVSDGPLYSPFSCLCSPPAARDPAPQSPRGGQSPSRTGSLHAQQAWSSLVSLQLCHCHCHCRCRSCCTALTRVLRDPGRRIASQSRAFWEIRGTGLPFPPDDKGGVVLPVTRPDHLKDRVKLVRSSQSRPSPWSCAPRHANLAARAVSGSPSQPLWTP